MLQGKGAIGTYVTKTEFDDFSSRHCEALSSVRSAELKRNTRFLGSPGSGCFLYVPYTDAVRASGTVPSIRS